MTAQIKWKKLRIRKKLFKKIFFKRWPVCTSKYQWKIRIISSNLFKYKAKFIEQHFSKTHFDASDDVTKVENFDKKCPSLSKENQKSPFKHIRFGRSKSPVKGFIKNSFGIFCQKH
jgi:hypothetical protein